MADYNIYIHDATTTSGSASQVSAWKPGGQNDSQTKAWSKMPQAEDSSGGLDITSIPAATKGIGAALKSHPYIAAAIVAVSVATKIIDVATPFITRETGDYRFQTAWSYGKNAVGIIMNPLGYIENRWRRYQENTLFNQKQEQERILSGERITRRRV